MIKHQERTQPCSTKLDSKDRNVQNNNKCFRTSSGKKRRRHRTAFTPTQLLGLENSFERGHYLVGDERKQLAVFLRLSETQIKVHKTLFFCQIRAISKMFRFQDF